MINAVLTGAHGEALRHNQAKETSQALSQLKGPALNATEFTPTTYQGPSERRNAARMAWPTRLPTLVISSFRVMRFQLPRLSRHQWTVFLAPGFLALPMISWFSEIHNTV